jgi:hypothetical protein
MVEASVCAVVHVEVRKGKAMRSTFSRSHAIGGPSAELAICGTAIVEDARLQRRALC